MTLRRLDIRGVRNLRTQSLRGLGRVNIFYGVNGSGKTSLLESIYLLGMARSFRSAKIKPVITQGEDCCTVFGEMAGNTGPRSLGVTRERGGGLEARVGGEKINNRAALAESLPLQVIHADSFNILTGGPLERRHFMDWGVFHVEHQFMSAWQRFQRAIKQRNNLLRRGKISSDSLKPWDRELAVAGEAIDRARKSYVECLRPHFSELLARLTESIEGLDLRYRRGWEQELSLSEALDRSLESDRQQGFTQVGPQRADLKVFAGGVTAADNLSRGQLKLVVCALKLAQARHFAEVTHRRCTFLVDDLTAELDRHHCSRVAEILEDMGSQVFITCIERDDVGAIWPRTPQAERIVFHVEHGQIHRDSP